MAATVTNRGSSWTTTAGNKTVTATPAVGDLIVVIAAATGGGPTAVTDTQSGTYVQVDVNRTGFSTSGILNAWVRTALVPAASSTTWTATETSSTGGGLIVYSISGMTLTGSSAVRSSGGQSSGSALSTPAPVLSLTPLSSNPIITAVANGTTPATFTPRTGYTEDADLGYGTPTTGLEASHKVSGETSATLTYGSVSATAFASIALEIQYNSAPNVALNTGNDTSTITLFDDFNGSLDSTKWSQFNTGTSTISQTGGEVVATAGSSTATVGYGGYDSVSSFNLTGLAASIEVATNVNSATGAQAYFKLVKDASNNVQWIYEAGTLKPQKTVAGSTSDITAGVTYSSSTHKYWRIRESGGSTFFDYSADGSSWTNHTSLSNPFVVTSMSVEFAAGTYQSVASPGAAHFDNFNVVDPTIVTTTTPQLQFTSTDADGDTVSYETQIDTASTFNSQGTSGAYVQSIGGQGSSGSATVSLPTAPTSGNLLVASAHVSQNAVPTMTGWTTATSNSIAGLSTIARGGGIFYKISNGTETSITASGGTATVELIVAEYSGIATSSSLDVADMALPTASSTSIDTATVTPTSTGDTLIVFATGGRATETWSGENLNGSTTGVTERQEQDASVLSLQMSDRFVSLTSGSYKGNGTASSATVGTGMIAIFKVNTSPLYDKLSNTDSGFTDITNGAHTDPFTSGEQIGYTVQAGNALTNGSTYYWRARGKDPSGSNAFGSWTAARSFTVSAGTVLTNTQSATARISATVTNTQSAISRIQNTVTKTQTAVARISKTFTKTQTSVARVQNTVTKTQTATARIQNTVTKTQTAVGRIQKTFTSTQSAISRIAKVTTKTQSSTARIRNTVTKTQAGTARIQNNVTKTQAAVARVQKTFTSTQSAISRIAKTFTSTQTAISRLSKVGTKTQTATGRVQNTVTKTQTGTARIQNTVTKTQTATSRIQKILTKTQSAVASIASAGSVLTKTQSATARIQKTFTNTQSATARISAVLTKTQAAVARVSKAVTKTQSAVARISALVTKTQSATARVSATETKTQTAVARIAKSFTFTQPAVSRISKVLTSTQPAVARVQATLTKTQTATAQIAGVTLTKTQTAKARIQVTASSTQTATARIIPTAWPLPTPGPTQVWIPESDGAVSFAEGSSDGSVIWSRASDGNVTIDPGHGDESVTWNSST